MRGSGDLLTDRLSSCLHLSLVLRGHRHLVCPLGFWTKVRRVTERERPGKKEPEARILPRKMILQLMLALMVCSSGCGLVLGAITQGSLYQVYLTSPASGASSPLPVNVCSITYCASSCMQLGSNCSNFAFKASTTLTASCDKPGLCQVRSSLSSNVPDTSYVIYKKM